MHELQGLDLHYSKELHLQGVELQYLAVFHVSADGTYALLAGPSSQVASCKLWVRLSIVDHVDPMYAEPGIHQAAAGRPCTRQTPTKAKQSCCGEQ